MHTETDEGCWEGQATNLIILVVIIDFGCRRGRRAIAAGRLSCAGRLNARLDALGLPATHTCMKLTHVRVQSVQRMQSTPILSDTARRTITADWVPVKVGGLRHPSNHLDKKQPSVHRNIRTIWDRRTCTLLCADLWQ